MSDNGQKARSLALTDETTIRQLSNSGNDAKRVREEGRLKREVREAKEKEKANVANANAGKKK